MKSEFYFGTDKIADYAECESYEAAGGVVTLRVKFELDEGSNAAFRDKVEDIVKNYLQPDDIQIVNIPRTVGVRIYTDAPQKEVKVANRSYGTLACASVSIELEDASGYGVVVAVFKGSI